MEKEEKEMVKEKESSADFKTPKKDVDLDKNARMNMKDSITRQQIAPSQRNQGMSKVHLDQAKGIGETAQRSQMRKVQHRHLAQEG